MREAKSGTVSDSVLSFATVQQRLCLTHVCPLRYFLITPKLLTGLAYHENMKVLCINNGDWLPDRLPLSRILTRRLANKQG